MTDPAADWRAAAEIGPYFAVELDASGVDWIELAVLVDDPAVLRERVDAARALLAERCGVAAGEIDLRATASIQFLGVVARLVSPALAVAVLTGTVPGLTASEIRWQRTAGGPIPVAVGTTPMTAADTEDGLAALLYDGVIATCVAPLVKAVRREYRLSSKVVWGNVASALGGAVAMLGRARPELSGRAIGLADRLLCKGSLVGTGSFIRSDEARSEPYFMRNNCCLFYRIPGGGTCGDCVLTARR